MNLCEYGCGQEAKHQFKNGKWCCNKSWQQCPGKKVLLEKNLEKEKVILKENKAPEQIISDSTIPKIKLKPLEPPAKIIKETIIPPTKKAIEETVPKKESIFKRIKNWFTF